MVPQGRKTRHGQAERPAERLEQESLAVLIERYPRVAFAISASSSNHQPAGIVHLKQLPPRPQCKIFTVSFFALLELFRWLPVILLAKLLLVRFVSAACEKPS